MRSLVYESDLYIDNKRIITKDMSIGERFELYILWEFYKSTEATTTSDFAHILEKKCESTNSYGLALYDDFKSVFMSTLNTWD